MASLEDLPVSGSLRSLTVEDGDYRSLDPSILRHMLFHLYLIRAFELELLELKDLGQVHGPVHSSVGQEGCAVGAMQVLQQSDLITSTHRGHHHFLAKALNAYAGSGYDPLQEVPPVVAEVTRRTMAEIMGLAMGYCKGRGGSMHLGDRFSGCLGTNGIVAGGVPSAAGTAWSHALTRSGHISVAFMGDGAANQGCVHETMNMAAKWRLPVVFFMENNLYAVATHVRESSAVEYLAQRALAYGIEGVVVDGMDPVAVYEAMRLARRHVAEQGPMLVESRTYRYFHQAQSLPGSAYGYRSREEEDRWREKDPHEVFSARLRELGAIDRTGEAELKARASEIVAEAAARLVEGEGRDRRVRAELYPPAGDLESDVRSDGREFAAARYSERGDFPQMRSRKFIDVIPEVIRRRMDTDERMIILGEEVAKMKGGVFSATKGIHLRHPDRVINTPISESGFTGMSLGLALTGRRPVVELMYPDFTLVAADQLFNQIGKCRYMYGGQYDVPLVLRTKVGIGTGYGAQHSLEPAALYALYPGWRIVAPATPFDYVGLFNAAVRCEDPVLVIEHALLYEESGEVPEDRDYLIELGRARVVSEGRDLTVVAYSYMVSKAARAVERLAGEGISVELVDLRTIDYASIDYETIGRSIRKTGRLLVAEEGLVAGGIGGQLAWEVQRRYFDELDAEIVRVAAAPVPLPVSRAQEQRALPGVEDLVTAVRSMVG